MDRRNDRVYARIKDLSLHPGKSDQRLGVWSTNRRRRVFDWDS